jgi:hypothetical protein
METRSTRQLPSSGPGIGRGKGDVTLSAPLTAAVALPAIAYIERDRIIRYRDNI